MLTEFGAVQVRSITMLMATNDTFPVCTATYIVNITSSYERTFDFLGYRMRDSQYLIQIV